VTWEILAQLQQQLGSVIKSGASHPNLHHQPNSRWNDLLLRLSKNWLNCFNSLQVKSLLRYLTTKYRLIYYRS
jgi:hypothetical protein